MSIATLIALCAGALFGAGLTISGMSDPARVRGFLDLSASWDPTLAFVMIGALAPMAIAWRVRARMLTPVVAHSFDLPIARRIDVRLLLGAVLFGIGWGIAGLCPGPAFAALALHPADAAIFVTAMLVGMVAHAALTAPPSRAPAAFPGSQPEG